MADRLEIDLLRTLKAIHDYRGVTKAAEHLCLSQSAVSHKIRRFEQSIGCQLLRRKPGQELLTSDGKHLVTYAEKIISMHDEALLGINRPSFSGQIHLGITEELINTKLSEVLGRFGRLYPDVRIKTLVEHSLVLEEMLAKSSLDMIVMQIFQQDVQSDDLVLQHDRLHWVKSVEHDLNYDQGIPFIAFDRDCFYRQWAEQVLRHSDQKLDVVIECASNQGVSNAILAGMGVAILAERHIQSGMEIIQIEQPPDIAFVIRANKEQPAKPMLALRDDIFTELSSLVG